MRLLLMIALSLVSTAALAVEEEFCALVIKAPTTGYVSLQDGPGPQFQLRAKLVVNDFLYVDSSNCSIYHSDVCTRSYTHVYSVHRLYGAPRDNLHAYTGGWVYSNYIKSVPCDRDWGYADPDGPQEDPH